VFQVAFPIDRLWTEPFSEASLGRRSSDNMANRRSGVARWRRELQDEEHEALVNLVNSLQISMQNASVQWQTAMDLLISQRQGIQQLRDEVDAIRIEVVELHSRPVSRPNHLPVRQFQMRLRLQLLPGRFQISIHHWNPQKKLRMELH
jgi:hypothetical protein